MTVASIVVEKCLIMLSLPFAEPRARRAEARS
jgi:hypothetical protein